MKNRLSNSSRQVKLSTNLMIILLTLAMIIVAIIYHSISTKHISVKNGSSATSTTNSNTIVTSTPIKNIQNTVSSNKYDVLDNNISNFIDIYLSLPGTYKQELIKQNQLKTIMTENLIKTDSIFKNELNEDSYHDSNSNIKYQYIDKKCYILNDDRSKSNINVLILCTQLITINDKSNTSCPYLFEAVFSYDDKCNLWKCNKINQNTPIRTIENQTSSFSLDKEGE